jgi:hypothetical protein
VGVVTRPGQAWSSAAFWAAVCLLAALAGCSAEPAPPAALGTPSAAEAAGGRRPEDSMAIPPSDAGPTDRPVDAAIADAGVVPDRAAADGPEGEGPCNGHPALCARRFDQVVFPTAHNAMSNADDGNWFIPNQTHNMRRQLRDGIRGLMLDTYRFGNGGGSLCHTNCNFGNRPLVDGLKDLAAFLRENPREVLALLIEDYLPAADTEKAFVEAGLQPFLYVHPAAAPWPTLADMIARGQRLVVMAQNGRPPPPWYHAMWDLLWDTPYTFRNENEFSCRENRGQPSNDLFLLNHWIENPVPDPRLSTIANARDRLLGRARQCQNESGKLPNFVAVNHYSEGALFEVVRTLNGL